MSAVSTDRHGEEVKKYPAGTDVHIKTLADGQVLIVTRPPEKRPTGIDTKPNVKQH